MNIQCAYISSKNTTPWSVIGHTWARGTHTKPVGVIWQLCIDVLKHVIMTVQVRRNKVQCITVT